MVNKFAGRCRRCDRWVAAGEGKVAKQPAGWATFCRAHAPVPAPALSAEGTVSVIVDGAGIKIKAQGYLGPDRFAAYRRATSACRYVPSDKSQACTWDALPATLEALRAEGFSLAVSPEVAARLQARKASAEAAVTAASERAAAVDAVLGERGLALFPFQRTGIEWLSRRDGALLADEMGLGKTIQALVAAPAGAPILVVCPAVAKGVWAREAAKWRPDLRVAQLSGRGSFRWPTAGELVVVNYDVLPASGVEAAPAGCVLVADEAHAVKNPKAQRTLRLRALSDAVRAAAGKVWLVTATPLLGKPPELWSVLKAGGLEAEVFGSWKRFKALFHGTDGEWGGIEWGKPSPEVAPLLQRAMLRRLKRDVLADLPPKRRAFVSVEIDAKARKQLDATLASIAKALGFATVEALLVAMPKALPAFEAMSRARALLAGLKTEAAVELVEQYEEQGEPVVVFSAHRAPIDHLAKRPGWAAITGDTAPEERRAIEEAFQAGRLRGVAATIQAGGVSITLTRATNAIFVDQDWTPALNSQAEDRIHRIGTVGSVLITVLVANHALDERVANLLNEKQGRIDGSVEQAVRGADERPEVAEATVTDEELAREAEVAVAAAKAEQAYVTGPTPHRDAAGYRAEPMPEPRPRRRAANAQEHWAEQALLTLSGLDDDHAAIQNGMGWSKMDGSFGHALAAQVTAGLTDTQWVAAVKLCRKYHRQIGRCPSETPAPEGAKGVA